MQNRIFLPSLPPIRDIANTDYTLEKLRELAPAALVGEQNFFIAYGLHKVA